MILCYMNFNPDTHCYCATCKTIHSKPRRRGPGKVVKNQGRNVTIISMHREGVSMVQIGIKFCMSKQAVHKIIKAYKEKEKETIKQ